MAKVHGVRGRASASVQVKRFPLFFLIQDRVHVPVGEENPPPQQMMNTFPRHFFPTS